MNEPTFVKKPIAITARRFWPERVDSFASIIVGEDAEGKPAYWVGTLEGNHRVYGGEWIVTGIKGEAYPVQDEIFRETYSPQNGEATVELMRAQDDFSGASSEAAAS